MAGPLIADTGGLLRAIATRPDRRPTWPAFERALRTASRVIIPALVLAEVDYFLRGNRPAMGELVADIFDPSTTYEFQPTTPDDIARAMTLDQKFREPSSRPFSSSEVIPPLPRARLSAVGTPSTAPTLDQISQALKSLVPPGYRAVLFGSRAGGRTFRGSDWDIGVLGPAPLDGARMSELRDALESIPTLHSFDLVDLATVPDEFRETALRTAVPLA